MFGGDHVSGSGEIHEYRTEVWQSGSDGDVQPVGDGRRVAEGTEPQAVAYAVPDVVGCQRDEEHPGQRAPRVLQAAGPHQQAQGEAESRDERGTVQWWPLGQIQSSLVRKRGQHSVNKQPWAKKMLEGAFRDSELHTNSDS